VSSSNRIPTNVLAKRWKVKMAFKVEEVEEDSSQIFRVAGLKVEVDSMEEMEVVAGLMVEAGAGDEAMEGVAIESNH
jgi:hypothetical protein